MAASLRIELFPKDMQIFLDFYTKVMRFTVLKHEATYAYVRRDGIFIGAVVGVPPHSPWKMVDEGSRKPPFGVEIVIEVDDVREERDFVVGKLGSARLEEDLTDRPWGLRDFRICDPDGYYLRITNRSAN